MSPTEIDQPNKTGRPSLNASLHTARMIGWAVVFLICLIVAILSISILYRIDLLPCEARDWEGCAAFASALQDFGVDFRIWGAYFLILRIITTLCYFILAGVLIWRMSDRVEGLWFSLFLVLVGTAGTWFNPLWYWLGSEVNPLLGVLGKFWADTLPSHLLTVALYIGLLITFHAFPDGQFVAPWSRLIVIGALPVIILNWGFPDTPLSFGNWPQPLPQVVGLILLGGTSYAPVYRLRHTDAGTQRQQVKWFVVGMAMPVLNYTVDFFTFEISPLLTGRYPLQTGRQQMIWEAVQDTHWYISSILFAVCLGVIIFRYWFQIEDEQSAM